MAYPRVPYGVAPLNFRQVMLYMMPPAVQRKSTALAKSARAAAGELRLFLSETGDQSLSLLPLPLGQSATARRGS